MENHFHHFTTVTQKNIDLCGLFSLWLHKKGILVDLAVLHDEPQFVFGVLVPIVSCIDPQGVYFRSKKSTAVDTANSRLFPGSAAMALGFFAKVDALNGGNDDSGRPAEHDDPVDRLGGGEETPAFIQNNFSITQRGEGDHGKVNGLLKTINRVQSQIGNGPDQHLHHGDNEHQKDDSADPVDT